MEWGSGTSFTDMPLFRICPHRRMCMYIIFIPNRLAVVLKSFKSPYVTFTHPPIHQFASLVTLLMLNGIPIVTLRISIDFRQYVLCAIPSTINLMDRIREVYEKFKSHQHLSALRRCLCLRLWIIMSCICHREGMQ